MSTMRITLIVTLFLPSASYACTPVPALGFLIGGSLPFSAMATGTVLGLAIVVAVKCLVYARAADYGMRRGMVDMLAGNVVSTIPGLFLGILVAFSSGITFAGLGLTAFVLAFGAGWLFGGGIQRSLTVSPWGLAILTPTAMLISFVLLSINQMAYMDEVLASRGTLAAYWAVKIAGIFFALLSAIAVSVVFEGAFIFRRHRKNEDFPRGKAFDALLKANLWEFFVAAVGGALLSLPQRLGSSGFLDM